MSTFIQNLPVAATKVVQPLWVLLFFLNIKNVAADYNLHITFSSELNYKNSSETLFLRDTVDVHVPGILQITSIKWGVMQLSCGSVKHGWHVGGFSSNLKPVHPHQDVSVWNLQIYACAPSIVWCSLDYMSFGGWAPGQSHVMDLFEWSCNLL